VDFTVFSHESTKFLQDSGPVGTKKKQKFRRFQTHKKFPIYLLGTEDYTYGIYLDSYEMHEAIGTFGGKLI
jgi:hypothetical protein